MLNGEKIFNAVFSMYSIFTWGVPCRLG